MKKFKTLVLSSVAFLCLCACSETPTDTQNSTADTQNEAVATKALGLNIQTIIPQDAEIAIYAKSNEALIKELKAKPEYKSIINALKDNFNKDLQSGFNQFLIESEPTEDEKNAITVFINPNDVIGSIEYLLLGQDISISAYCKNAENIKINKLAEIVFALKSGNPEFPEKILNLLNLMVEDEEIPMKKSKVEGYDCFSLGIGTGEEFYIINVKDTFLFTAGELALENLMAAVKNPSKSILDSKRFNNTIEDADSDLWVYINEQIFSLASVAAEEEIPLKSAGVEMKLLSLESAMLKAKLNLAKNEFSPFLENAFPSYNTTPSVKNVYDDTKLYISMQIPKNQELANLIESQVPFGNGLAPILMQLNRIDIAFPEQDIEILENEKFKGVFNIYLDSVSDILRTIPVPLQNVYGFECLDAPEMLIAKINENQISVIVDKSNLEADLVMASSQKGNKKIENLLNEIPMENCIAEAYLDGKYIGELLQKANLLENNNFGTPDFYELNYLFRDTYEESNAVAKLGFSNDSISFVLKSDSKINWEKYEEATLIFIKELKEEIKETKRIIDAMSDN